LALGYSSRHGLSPEAVLEAGNQWAKKAKARIFADLDDLSLEKLMVPNIPFSFYVILIFNHIADCNSPL
jgi:hypothetical protein